MIGMPYNYAMEIKRSMSVIWNEGAHEMQTEGGYGKCITLKEWLT